MYVITLQRLQSIRIYIEVRTDLRNTDLLILHCTLKTKEAWMTVLTVETEEFPWNLDI